MKAVGVQLSSLKQTKAHEYAARFLFGGISTVVAGLIAKRFGPGIGGLFLAFPAIFPASASLIENHEKARKAQAGYDGTKRGRIAASVDAAGASIGCIGMIGARLDVPVITVRLDGIDRILPTGSSFAHPSRVRVAFGAPMALHGDDYTALAKQVEDAVRAF